MDAGCRVRLHGLVARAELNSTVCTLTGPQLTNGRYPVKLDDGQELAVKLDNLTLSVCGEHAPCSALARTCWGCGAVEGEVVFQQCQLCVDRKLAPSFFCGRECQKASWPRHKLWHEEAKENASRGATDAARSKDEFVATFDERVQTTAQSLQDVFATHGYNAHAQAETSRYMEMQTVGLGLMHLGNLAKAAKTFRKSIKLCDKLPFGFYNLALVLLRSNDAFGGAQHALKAVECLGPLHSTSSGVHDQTWAECYSLAFKAFYSALHKSPATAMSIEPPWWNDGDLRRISKIIVEKLASDADAWEMRAWVLCGMIAHTYPTSSIPEPSSHCLDCREAARCFFKQAELAPMKKTRCLEAAANCMREAQKVEELARQHGVPL